MHEMLREYFYQFPIVLFPFYLGIVSASGIAIYSISRYIERKSKRILVSLATSAYLVVLVAAVFSSHEVSSPSSLCSALGGLCFTLMIPWHSGIPLFFFWLPIAAMLIYAARVPRPNIVITLLFGIAVLLVGLALFMYIGHALHAAAD